jgi:phosphoglucomutase
VKNFETETIRDVEGDVLPKEKMMIFELEDKTRVAVRGSGTEPKIKYYLFLQSQVQDAAILLKLKKESADRLEKLWEWLRNDASQRAKA